MERRNFLKVLPLIPLQGKIVKDGILSVEVPKDCHLLFFIDANSIEDPDSLLSNPAIMPPGATGGAIIWCKGNPEEAVKIYRLDKGGD